MAERHDGGGRKTAATDNDRLVKSAHRVMQVFEFFGERRGPINATDIARSLGFPQSSTSMLLKSLMTLGYLEYRHDSRTFRPTIRLSLLGGWVPDQLCVADRLLTLLRRLHEFTGETVLLGAPHRHCVRSIFVLPGGAPDRYEMPTGALRPLCANAMGHALLTLRSENDVRGIIRRVNAEEEEASRRVSPAALFERLDRCRAQGFAASEECSEGEAMSMVAILLPPQEDGAQLCAAVAAPTGRFRQEAPSVVQYMRDLVGRSEVASPIAAKRAGAGGDRREGGFVRPDIHLVHARAVGSADS